MPCRAHEGQNSHNKHQDTGEMERWKLGQHSGPQATLSPELQLQYYMEKSRYRNTCFGEDQ